MSTSFVEPPNMPPSIAAANRVARVIQVAKVLLLILLGISTVTGLVIGLISAGSGSSVGVVIILMSLFSAMFYGAIVYVAFGWFEHTLRLLASIANQTGL